MSQLLEYWNSNV